MNFKDLFKRKVFWTWFLGLIAFVIVAVYFLISNILTLILITLGAVVLGLVIDLIRARKKKRK